MQLKSLQEGAESWNTCTCIFQHPVIWEIMKIAVKGQKTNISKSKLYNRYKKDVNLQPSPAVNLTPWPTKTLCLYSCDLLAEIINYTESLLWCDKNLPNIFLNLRNSISWVQNMFYFYWSVVWNIVIYTIFQNGMPCVLCARRSIGQRILQLIKINWFSKTFSGIPFT